MEAILLLSSFQDPEATFTRPVDLDAYLHSCKSILDQLPMVLRMEWIQNILIPAFSDSEDVALTLWAQQKPARSYGFERRLAQNWSSARPQENV